MQMVVYRKMKYEFENSISSVNFTCFVKLRNYSTKRRDLDGSRRCKCAILSFRDAKHYSQYIIIFLDEVKQKNSPLFMKWSSF